MMIKKILITTFLISTLYVVACNKQSPVTDNKIKSDMATIKIGVISGPEQYIAEAAKEKAKTDYNLDVELVDFNDYATPNQALNDGLIDANVFQHKPYLDQQISERGYKFSIVGNAFLYPIASYSHKLKPVTSIQNLKKGALVSSFNGKQYLLSDGATIAIPNDPTNLGRALLLLQQQGLITVDPKKGLLVTSLDILSNPHHLNIVELEAPMLPRALDDKQIDLAIINNAFAGQAGLTLKKEGIFIEDKHSPYVNIIVTREDKKNDKNIINFVKAYQTEAVNKKANAVFNGTAIKGW